MPENRLRVLETWIMLCERLGYLDSDETGEAVGELRGNPETPRRLEKFAQIKIVSSFEFLVFNFELRTDAAELGAFPPQLKTKN